MDAYAQYRTQAVTTASPAQLVAMLYQGALTAITVAEQALAADDGDRELAHRELVRAQAIVTELTVSLDHEQGGEIARSLASLYEFCSERLLRANVSKDAGLLPGVRRTLAGLAEAWNEMIQQQATDSLASVGA